MARHCGLSSGYHGTGSCGIKKEPHRGRAFEGLRLATLNAPSPVRKVQPIEDSPSFLRSRPRDRVPGDRIRSQDALVVQCGAISLLCDYPKRDPSQRAVTAGDPIGRETALFCHGRRECAVNAAENNGAQLGCVSGTTSGDGELCRFDGLGLGHALAQEPGLLQRYRPKDRESERKDSPAGLLSLLAAQDVRDNRPQAEQKSVDPWRKSGRSVNGGPKEERPIALANKPSKRKNRKKRSLCGWECPERK